MADHVVSPEAPNDAGVTDVISLARHRSQDVQFFCTGVSDVTSRQPHRSPPCKLGGAAGPGGWRLSVSRR